jgi:hypothetical protein
VQPGPGLLMGEGTFESLVVFRLKARQDNPGPIF